jgi:ribosomal protein L28
MGKRTIEGMNVSHSQSRTPVIVNMIPVIVSQRNDSISTIRL